MIKLPDFFERADVKLLFQEMGITEIAELPVVEFVKTRVEIRETIIPNTKQLQFAEKIKLKDVPLAHETFTVANDETLEVNGVKCCIYIKNQSWGVDFSCETSTYRFHLCNCKKIQEMVSNGRKERYVATSRDDGEFPVNVQSHGKAIEKNMCLELCKLCKNILVQKNMYGEPFSLKSFYEKYQPEIPRTFKRTEHVPLTEKYAPDHTELAHKYKESVNYVCQICGVDCSQHPSYLHMHHRNGEGTDNRRINLNILCVVCHMAQPCHGGMKRIPKYRMEAQRVQQLQKEQGLLTVN